MIPKVIHYCWFGGQPKPELAQKCIRSWEKFCPDYQIIEWNEDNYDLRSAPLYVRQAIEAKKWAFATDYIRLDVVYEHGGIYLDTDVELIKGLDQLLHNKGYFGFITPDQIASGHGFGAEKHVEILHEIMESYENLEFSVQEKDHSYVTNLTWETAVLLAHGLIPDGKEQMIDGMIHIYPEEYFSPYHFQNIRPKITPNTVSIHWCATSWASDVTKKYGSGLYKLRMHILRFPNRVLIMLLGKERYKRLKHKLKKSVLE